MSATLNPGIKAVHLVLSRPTYLRPNNTTDTRDDYQSVKVWYSKVTPFDPTAAYNAVSNPWILYSENGGLITTIDGLDEDVTYYVKYAYVSKIDPDTYTVSSQLSAKTLAAGVHVYGYLSNDPVNISTDSAGTILVTVNGALVANPTSTQQQAAWTTASSGTFKVYNDNAEVTGANTTNVLASDGSVVGPRYSIKAGSYTGDLTSSNTFIDSITGAFYSTGVGVANYNNSVIFLAKYNGVTVERTWTVTKGRGGQTAPLIQLSANTTEFVYKQEIDTDSVTTSAVIKARLANITGQIAWLAYAYTRSGSPLGAISGTQDQVNNTFTITAAQFGYYGVTTGYVLATATSVSDNTISDTITLYRINDGSNQITVEQTNGSHLITADALGNTTYNDYDGSGNTITVKKGNKTLLIDNTSSDNFSADTWRILSIVPSGISHDASYVATQGAASATFSRASGMTADVAYIDYTIRVQQVAGNGSTATQYLDTTVRQSFAKSKAGVNGRGVNLTSDYANFTTASGTTTALPATIILTATAKQFINPTYSWTIDGSTTFTGATQGTGANVNKLTLNSFASGNPVPSKTIRVTVSETVNGISYEQFDQVSISSLKEGDPGISYNLTNGNQTIYYDSTGTIKAGQLDGTLDTTNPQYFKCKYEVKRGTTLLNGTSAVSFSLATSSGMTAAINASSGVISVSALSSEFASATFYALVDGTTIYTQILTLNRSKDGASAPIINLTALKQAAFIKSPATSTDQGTWSPSTITLNADTFNIPTGTTYYWSVAVNEGSFTDLTSGVDLKQYSVSQFTSGTKTYKIQATANGQTINDVQTIYALESGGNGITVGLANPSQQISCSALGVPSSGINITTEFLALRGTDFINSAYFTFSQTAQTGLTNTTTTINSSGIITVPSSYIDSSISVKQATITYRMFGTAGTPGAGIDVSKVLTITKTLDGAKGSDGKSSYTATVYTQSASIPTVAPTGGSYDFSNSTLSVPSSSGFTWSPTLPTSSATLTTYSSSYTFITTGTSTSVSGGTWSQPVAILKNGTNGINADTLSFEYSSDNVNFHPNWISGDVYVHVKKVSGVDSSVTYGPSQKYIPTLGVEYTVTNGKTAYLHIKYSDDGGASFTANSGESAGSWIGTYSDNTEADSMSLSAYIWTKLTGNQGNPGNPGPRNASGYLYYSVAQATQPSAPGTNGLGLYNFSTNTFASLGSWSFTAPSPSASSSYTGTDSKVWAIRYSVSETTYNLDSTQTSTFTSAFNVINFEGLVTFTNATTSGSPIKNALDGKITGSDIYTSGTTTIDGGKITSGTIDVQRLSVGPYSAPGVLRSSGERIIVSQSKIEVFDASNVRRVVIGNLG